MSRLLYNQAIIDKLQELIKKYPDLRFGQLLLNCDAILINRDPFYEESELTWNRMCKNKFCFSNEQLS